MKKTVVSAQVGQKEITIETGIMAKQADGATLVRCGSNVVMVVVTSSKQESKLDFFPLTCEYQERYYAAGRIPGGFFKREAKPTPEATLIARLLDRPIRPKFPEGYRNDTQVIAYVLSTDGTYPLESLASIGASASLHISDIPFDGPTASVVVGRIDGNFVANPSHEELQKSDMEIIVAGSRQGILMVEGEAKFISEDDALQALKFGHSSLTTIFDAQDELKKLVGREKREFTPFKVDEEFRKKAEDFLKEKITAALGIREKLERYAAADAAKAEAKEALLSGITDADELALRTKELGIIVGDLKYDIARSQILDTSSRIDGRDLTTVRPIACEVGLLPRAHGSGLFTRGETQVLGTVTLGTGEDEQIIDSLSGHEKKRQFLLHYNFPPFCVGETGRIGFTSRREIGHGNLAERALKAVLPPHTDFPYTIRVVSEVLESNGSSSMGTVCAGTMSLLDAGVPIRGNVAGIAMGLISEGDRTAILSDILGDEDHLGDMDFKVAGTGDGITSLQMDIKIDSLTFDVMEKALYQAKDGRLHILGKMEEVIKQPRGQVSEYAPRIVSMKVKPEKVREVIGAGGKVIRGIIEETGVKINIDDDGTINIASTDPEATKKAISIIEGIITEPEVGQTYKGKVVKITDFGAFVEILPNTQGLLHISEVAHDRIRQVTDVLNEGEEVDVKVLDIDRAGRLKLSRKALIAKEN